VLCSVQHEVLADEQMSGPTLEALVEKFKESEEVLAVFEELQVPYHIPLPYNII